MARTLSRTRPFIGALQLPLLATLVVASAVSCSSSKEEETGTGVDRIVYAVRQHTVVEGNNVSINVADGMGQVMDYGRYVPGGRLEVLDLRTGDVENIVEDFPRADIASVDVSFDATRVLFSMKKNENDYYHIYWASLDRGEDGKYELHQVTFDPFDDIHGVWLAGGKIAFVTNQSYTDMGTRADEYNHSQQVTQIAVSSLDGGERKLCSQNLSNTFNLFSLKDGRLAYSRWEHVGMKNHVATFAMHPDCTSMVALTGEHNKPGNSLVQVSETNTQNVFLGILTTRENTIQAGTLVQFDLRSDVDHSRVDEERPAKAESYTFLTPAVPVGEEPSPIGRYRAPTSLPDGRILVSWANGFVNEQNELALNPPDYGVYVYDPGSRTNNLVVNYENSWELYARPVVARSEPPLLSSIQNTPDSTVPTTFGSIDIKNTSLSSVHQQSVSGAQFGEGTPTEDALRQAKKVRIIEGFSSEAAPGATMFGLTMEEGAALLGEATVYADGSWLAKIPPYLPVRMQPVDEFDLAIRTQTTWIQGMPGENRVCGGCHESRTSANLPGGQQQTTATGKGAQDFLIPVLNRVEYPWYGGNGSQDDLGNSSEVQALLTAKCAQCHNESTNGNGPQEFYSVQMDNQVTGTMATYQIPRLDLSAREITVTYDGETKPWPASYVSLFYPDAVEMEIGMGASVTGTIPPKWAIPTDARNSAAIEKLNIVSFLDPNKTAWEIGQPFSDPDIKGGTRTMHPDDVGVTLTREERLVLIRAIDMGGQYYSRKNTGFQPYGNDPVSGQQF